ncbi:Kinase, putative [Theobroma cacao]|uniref:Kinase, putative n=1 Tax=Theobroma cacao TaxID=3641 RepID=A0A061EUK1_THECC|nr:Kinase, putative [Theobroma cacao]
MRRNVGKFIGWCLRENEFFLVYEYIPNNNLESHLHGNETSLPWYIWYKVAKNLVSAIQYLHEGAEKCAIHRDIKSENILLDKYFIAKLGDFGIAKLKGLRTSQTSVGP